MSTPGLEALTSAQLEALVRAFGDRDLTAYTAEPWAFAFEEEAMSPYMGRKLEALGLVRRYRLGHFPFHVQLQLMDAGRAALEAIRAEHASRGPR